MWTQKPFRCSAIAVYKKYNRLGHPTLFLMNPDFDCTSFFQYLAFESTMHTTFLYVPRYLVPLFYSTVHNFLTYHVLSVPWYFGPLFCGTIVLCIIKVRWFACTSALCTTHLLYDSFQTFQHIMFLSTRLLCTLNFLGTIICFMRTYSLIMSETSVLNNMSQDIMLCCVNDSNAMKPFFLSNSWENDIICMVYLGVGGGGVGFAGLIRA